ncbi:MAG: hypothetical protein JNK57_02980 [Planctomycetaceae bacterium]|nr:hypothetical protein [Planctomycetaceae bacterium]
MRTQGWCNHFARSPVNMVGLVCLALSAVAGWAQDVEPPTTATRSQATVGSVGRLKEVLLPGSLLRVKPLDDRDAPIVVRIVDSFPHGDSHRYDLTYMALEPGRYDLREALERVDGSELGELPQIPVEVVSVLEAGHIPPHDLELTWPRLGSYRFWVILAIVGWVLVLLTVIFWPKHRQEPIGTAAKARTLADLLQPRLQAAAAGQLDSRQLAELERWLVEFWRRRLGLQELQPRQALMELRKHELAGPLLQQMERWLHSPGRDPKASLGELLAPYNGLEVPGELAGTLPQTTSEPSSGVSA